MMCKPYSYAVPRLRVQFLLNYELLCCSRGRRQRPELELYTNFLSLQSNLLDSCKGTVQCTGNIVQLPKLDFLAPQPPSVAFDLVLAHFVLDRQLEEKIP